MYVIQASQVCALNVEMVLLSFQKLVMMELLIQIKDVPARVKGLMQIGFAQIQVWIKPQAVLIIVEMVFLTKVKTVMMEI